VANGGLVPGRVKQLGLGNTLVYSSIELSDLFEGGQLMLAQGSVAEMKSGGQLLNGDLNGFGVLKVTGASSIRNSTVTLQSIGPTSVQIDSSLMLANSSMAVTDSNIIIGYPFGDLTLENSYIILRRSFWADLFGFDIGHVDNRGYLLARGDSSIVFVETPDGPPVALVNDGFTKVGDDFFGIPADLKIQGTLINRGDIVITAGSLLEIENLPNLISNLSEDACRAPNRESCLIMASGTLSVEGNLELPSGGGLLMDGGTVSLGGSGVISGNVFNEAGTFSSEFRLSTDPHIVGDYHQGRAALMDFHVDPFLTPLIISGLADLDGRLNILGDILLEDGFRLRILRYGSFTGGFSAFNSPSGEFFWEPQYGANELVVYLRSLTGADHTASFDDIDVGVAPVQFPDGTQIDFQAIPEPGSLVLVAIGLAGVIIIRRRRQSVIN
jgi:hypothetical protein